MRYKLRTLLILLAVLPPLLWFGWTKYEAWKAERERQEAMERYRAELIAYETELRQLKAARQSGRMRPPATIATDAKALTGAEKLSLINKAISELKIPERPPSGPAPVAVPEEPQE